MKMDHSLKTFPTSAGFMSRPGENEPEFRPKDSRFQPKKTNSAAR
jgi:hypothetical protein